MYVWYTFVHSGVQVTEKLRTSVDMWDEWEESEDDWDEEAEIVGEEVPEKEEDEEDEEEDGVEDGMFEEWEEGEGDGEPARSVELNVHNQIILLARGGAGGVGNFATKGAGSNTTQKSRKPTLPGQVVKGALGEAKTFLLEVKLIADVGLVGYPNVRRPGWSTCRVDTLPCSLYLLGFICVLFRPARALY
jgi:GTPase involved in cell partitioning and DNA repair